MKGWIYLFVVIFLVSYVCAEENGCCPLTFAGDSCRYTSESNCAEGFVANVLCEESDVCSTGCCVSSNGCFDGAGEYTCSLNSGNFFEAVECSTLEACEMTCCKVGSDYNFVEYGECRSLMDEYGEIVEIISANSEEECEELEDAEEKGCCVTSEECSYVTQEDCGASNYDAEGFGFFNGEYCADVASYLTDHDYASAEYCACETTGNVCSEDLMDVVETDSCGNYGKVVEECDFPEELCIEDGNGAYCGTGECSFALPSKLVPYNPLWENDFINGESRCLYEGPAGNYQDLPGSRHYVVRCLVGELVLEPCDDFREQVCVDNYIFDIDYADCETNTVDSGEEVVTTVPKGEEFWEYYESDETSALCSNAVVSCEPFFGESTLDNAWECDANCFCLRKEWSMLMAEYCNAGGDCGNGVNLVGGSSEGNFEMTRSVEGIQDRNNRYTEVGCGDGCIDESITADDARGIQCYDEDTDCSFYTWNKIKSSYMKSLENRVTGSYSYFTLLDYVGFDPDLILKSTEFLYSPESNLFVYINLPFFMPFLRDNQCNKEGLFFDYFGVMEITKYIIYQDNSQIGIYFCGEEFCDPNIYDLFGNLVSWDSDSCIVYDFDDSWISYINDYRDKKNLDPLTNLDLKIILGEKFVLEDIVDPLAQAPEYSSRTKFSPVTVSSTCGSWVAPEDGDCSLCEKSMSEGGLAIEDPNGNIFVGYECSKYKCKSLGRDCEWIDGNEDTGRPVCVDVPDDTNAPVITLWNEKIEELGYEYVEKEDGTDIINAPLGRIQMPVLTDDFAKCKISDDPHLGIPINDDEAFNSIDSIVDDPIIGYSQEHNFTYLLDEGSKEYDFFIWCEDFSLNPTPVFYMFKVFTTAEPDTDAPEIDGISPGSGTYVKNGETSISLTLYLNEDGYCKYSSQDIAYEQMTSEFASCAESNGIFNYVCSAIIPLSAGTTSLYIKCADTNGYVMDTAEHWYVSESLPLLITQTLPTGTLYTNEIVLMVDTEDGADSGKADCYYEGLSAGKQKMAVTGGGYHEQRLSLEKGSYSYSITCEDSLENEVSSMINFIVDKDLSAAEITGVYYLGTNIYVLTNEATSCQYKTESFSYGNGYDLGGVAGTAHSFTPADLTATYYINCIDAYSNILEDVKINLGYLL